jgi:hypothetical protein
MDETGRHWGLMSAYFVETVARKDKMFARRTNVREISQNGLLDRCVERALLDAPCFEPVGAVMVLLRGIGRSFNIDGRSFAVLIWAKSAIAKRARGRKEA